MFASGASYEASCYPNSRRVGRMASARCDFLRPRRWRMEVCPRRSPYHRGPRCLANGDWRWLMWGEDWWIFSVPANVVVGLLIYGVLGWQLGRRGRVGNGEEMKHLPDN